jgi:hypothetical protein
MKLGESGAHLPRLKIMLEENGSIKENRPTSSS